MCFAKVIIINNQNTSFTESVRSSGCIFIQYLLLRACVRACVRERARTVQSKTVHYTHR
jgi:hypothetical protein